MSDANQDLKAQIELLRRETDLSPTSEIKTQARAEAQINGTKNVYSQTTA